MQLNNLLMVILKQNQRYSVLAPSITALLAYTVFCVFDKITLFLELKRKPLVIYAFVDYYLSQVECLVTLK